MLLIPKIITALILAAALTACKPGQVTTQTTIQSVEVGSEKICAKGTFSITADTKALRDSLLELAKNEVIQVKVLADTGNISVYQFIICSPKSKK